MSEQMINSRQAAMILSLPHYWFCDREMRAKHRIPHYRLVGLVRFRASELQVWATNIARGQASVTKETEIHEEEQ